MSIYDSLISTNTSTSSKSSGTIYDSLIPTAKTVPTTPVQTPSNPGVLSTVNSLSHINLGSAIVSGAIKGFQNTPSVPKTLSATAPGQATMDAFTNAINQGGKNLSDQFDVITSNASTLQKGVAVGQAAVGTVNSIFGALLSPLQGYATVPVIGNVVDGVNKVFGAIGEGAGAGAAKLVSDSSLSQSTKDTITPLVHDTAALVAQIYAGKGAEDIWSKVSDNSKQIMTTLSNDPAIQKAIQDQHPIGTKVPVTSETPAESSVKITNGEQVKLPVTSKTPNETNIPINEGYIPDNKLPTIDYGKSPSEFPTIQTEPPASNKLGDMTVEPIKPVTPEVTDSTGQSVPPVTSGKSMPADIRPPSVETQPTNPVQTIAPEVKAPDTTTQTPEVKSPVNDAQTPKPTTGNTVSGVAKSIEAKAIEQKLTTSYPDKATFEGTTFKEQSAKAADLINSGIDNARAVVRGEVPMPEGLRSAPLIAGMEEYAKQNPEQAGPIMQELANSHLASTISEGASETSLARMREQDSATQKLQDIRKAKEDAVGKDKITKARKTAQTEGNKMLLPKESTYWAKFLNDISC